MTAGQRRTHPQVLFYLLQTVKATVQIGLEQADIFFRAEILNDASYRSIDRLEIRFISSERRLMKLPVSQPRPLFRVAAIALAFRLQCGDVFPRFRQIGVVRDLARARSASTATRFPATARLDRESAARNSLSFLSGLGGVLGTIGRGPERRIAQQSRGDISCRSARRTCPGTWRGSASRPDLPTAVRKAMFRSCPCRSRRHLGRKSRKDAARECPIPWDSTNHQACSVAGRGFSSHAEKQLWQSRKSDGPRRASYHGRTKSSAPAR